MSEKLTIVVDFVTDEAMRKSQSVIAAIEETGRAAEAADKGVQQLEKGTAALGTTAANASKQVADAQGNVAKLAGASKETHGEVNRAKDAVQKLGDAAGGTAPKVAATGDALDKVSNTSQEAQRSATAASTAVAQLGTASASTAKNIIVAGHASREAGVQIIRFGKAAATSGNEAQKSMEGVSKTAVPMGGFFQHLAGEAKNWVLGFAGLGGVVALIQQMKQDLQEMEQVRNRLLEGKGGMDVRIEKFRANLGGLPDTTEGRQRAFEIFEQLSQQVPEASPELLMEVAGQASAFQYDVKGPGVGRDISNLLAAFASGNQLTPEVAGNLPRLARALNVNTIADAQKMLATMMAGQKNTGISNPSDYINQLLRLMAQFVPQGMTMNETIGLLAGVTTGATEPRVIGTRAEQVMGVVMGKDEQVQANLGRRAAAMGVISQAGIDQSVQSLVAEELPKHQEEFAGIDRDIVDAEEAKRQAENRFAHDKPSSRLTAEQRQDREDEHKFQLKQYDDRLADLRKKRNQIEDDARKAAQEKAAAAAYRRLSPGQKLGVVAYTARNIAGIDQRNEFFSQELKGTQDEIGALATYTGEGGTTAATAASEAAARVGPAQVAEVQQDVEGYRQSPLGQAQAAQTSVAISEYKAITGEDEQIYLFQRRSSSRADIFLKKWDAGELSDTQKRGFENTTNPMTRFLIFRNDVVRQIYDFLGGMSDEERRAHPEILQFVKAAHMVGASATDAVASYDAWYSQLRDILRRFIYSARVIATERAKGKYETRTMSSPPKLYQYNTTDIGTEPNATPSHPSVGQGGLGWFAPNTEYDAAMGGVMPSMVVMPLKPEQMPKEQKPAVTPSSSPKQQPTPVKASPLSFVDQEAADNGFAASAPQPAGQPLASAEPLRPIINVHIGSYFPLSGGEADLVGRLEAMG